jgi:hypothetical protein
VKCKYKYKVLILCESCKHNLPNRQAVHKYVINKRCNETSIPPHYDNINPKRTECDLYDEM